MGNTDQLNGKTRGNPKSAFLSRISNKVAFLVAIGGGLVAAIFAVLIPISTLEAFTGASGLSEIIPATRAPLGSSARTLFVIFTAILAASILLVLLLTFRKQPEENSNYSDVGFVNEIGRERKRMTISEGDAELAERIYHEDEDNFRNFHQKNKSSENDKQSSQKRNIASIAGGAIAAGSAGLLAVGSSVKSKLNKLPFMGGDDSIKSFDDLPKLRDADKHPDAPARRPLSAHEDLGERILDQESDQKNIVNGASDRNLSDSNPISYPVEEVAEYSSDESQNRLDKNHDDIFLQPLIVNEEPIEVSDELNVHHDREASEVFADKAEAEHSINNAVMDDNIVMDENSDKIVREDKASGHDGLPTIDSLMTRLEVLVERRAERLKPDDKTAVLPVESNLESELKTNVHEEAQLDKHINVIDDVAKKRAEKRALQERRRINNEDLPENIKPTATISIPRAVDTNSNGDEGDTIVTKSQKIEMDNALKSALDTLHKMTERSA